MFFFSKSEIISGFKYETNIELMVVVKNKNVPAENTIFLSKSVKSCFIYGLNLIIKNKLTYVLSIMLSVPKYINAFLYIPKRANTYNKYDAINP